MTMKFLSPRAALLALLCCALPGSAFTEELPGVPRSREEAIKMEQADALPRTAFYESASLKHSQPGQLLRQESFAGYALPKGASAVRILYHSLDADGKSVVTSGVVLLPAGSAPAGGWPVIAWAHGTSGVARQCAPSLSTHLVYGEEGLMPMVRAGFAVVATDYHGLGTQGAHEYVNKIAQGHDVIFSVPAARMAVPALGKRWVVIGHSQGGLAAWGVAEMQNKLRDPDYLGAVSVAGAANPLTLISAMGANNSAAAFYLDYLAYAMHVRTPSFQPDQMLVGTALRRYPDLISKGCWNYAYASFLKDPPQRVLKEGWGNTAGAKRLMSENALGLAPVHGPLLVVSGEADQTVLIGAQRDTARLACSKGVKLAFRSYPGLDHDPVMEQSTPDQLAWVRERFAGKPFTPNCGDLAH